VFDINRRDKDAIKKLRWLMKPFLCPFRVEIEGLRDLPSEPFLFIANHNIGAAVEIAALIDAWYSEFEDRPVFGLTHPFAFRVPLFRTIVSKYGAIPATYDSAYEALASGASLIIFPGGNWEAVRPYSRRFICDLGNHYGWARIALQTKRRVVPISISGSHAVNPVLLRSRWLTTILIIPRLLGLKYFPISISQIFWGALFYFATKSFVPFWLCLLLSFLGFTLTPLIAIWPSKIKIRFGKPIDIQDLTVEMAYARVSADIQAGMDQS
jgi:1-acyl-sn-glycerol-3-phosphate acyltransferase